jgi:hypothetical protein
MRWAGHNSRHRGEEEFDYLFGWKARRKETVIYCKSITISKYRFV